LTYLLFLPRDTMLARYMLPVWIAAGVRRTFTYCPTHSNWRCWTCIFCGCTLCL